MTGTLFRTSRFDLDHLVKNIERGDVALPEIQRPFVWPNRQGARPDWSPVSESAGVVLADSGRDSIREAWAQSAERRRASIGAVTDNGSRTAVPLVVGGRSLAASKLRWHIPYRRHEGWRSL
jgi:hypothetical protein